MPSSSSSSSFDPGRRFAVFVKAFDKNETRIGSAVFPVPDSSNLMPWLEPVMISHASNGELSEARIMAHAHPEDLMFDNSNGYYIAPQSAVLILDYWQNTDITPGEFSGTCVCFAGIVTKVRMALQGEQEYSEIICHSSLEHMLSRIVVHGQVHYDYNTQVNLFSVGQEDLYPVRNNTLVLTDQPCVFNPDGRGNCSGQIVRYKPTDEFPYNRDTYLFEVPNWQTAAPIPSSPDGIKSPSILSCRPWTVSRVLKYLLSFYPVETLMNLTNMETTINTFFGIGSGSSSSDDLTQSFLDPVVHNLNLEGKDLLTALRLLLEPYNIIFSFQLNGTQPSFMSLFLSYRGKGLCIGAPGAQNTITVSHPAVGTLEPVVSLSLSERGTAFQDALTTGGPYGDGTNDNGVFVKGSNVISMDLLYDSTNVVNELVVMGDYGIVTTMAHTDPITIGKASSSSSGNGYTDYFKVMSLVPGWDDNMLYFPDPPYIKNTTTVDIYGEIIFPDLTSSSSSSDKKTFLELYCTDPDLLTSIASVTSYGVGRLWIVNSGERTNRDLQDFLSATHSESYLSSSSSGVANTQVFGQEINEGESLCPRKMEMPAIFETSGVADTLEPNPIGIQQNIFVEMSTDQGKNWFIVPKKYYRVLPANNNFEKRDIMGIVFHELELDQLTTDAEVVEIIDGTSSSSGGSSPGTKDYWTALYESKSRTTDGSNMLQIRIVCGLKSDTKMKLGIKPDDWSDPDFKRLPLVRQGLYENSGFKEYYYNQYIDDNYSLYKLKNQSYKAWAFSSALEMKNALFGLAAYQRDPLYCGQIVLMLDWIGQYIPGTTISSVMPRGMTFYPSISILRTVYDLKSQHVHLTVDSHLIHPVIGRTKLPKGGQTTNVARNILPNIKENN